MLAAVQEAHRAYDEGEVPIGAVVVVDNQIIASNHNRTEQQHDPIAHAEILVIRDACQHVGYERLTEASLYVTVEPCVMCAGALVLSRMKRLVYGANNPKGGAVCSLYAVAQDARLNHQLEVVAGVMRDECRRLMSSFFQQLRSGEVPKRS